MFSLKVNVSVSSALTIYFQKSSGGSSLLLFRFLICSKQQEAKLPMGFVHKLCTEMSRSGLPEIELSPVEKIDLGFINEEHEDFSSLFV
ncbi:hypothetical protein GEMRC1_002596 [Eukaryota sp. GEM-RC1]